MHQDLLLSKVKKHDRAAQKQFYHAYVKLVSRIAFRYLNNSESAQDAVQNTFIRVFQNIDMYDAEKGKLKSWISRITVNESLAIIRTQKRFQSSPLESLEIINDSYLDDQVFAKFELEEVSQVIEQLEDEQRIILDLFFYEDYSHQEISELLNISVQFSRVKLYRAKKAFYQKWSKTKGNEIQRTI